MRAQKIYHYNTKCIKNQAHTTPPNGKDSPCHYKIKENLKKKWQGFPLPQRI
jgi:hypothetical protein